MAIKKRDEAIEDFNRKINRLEREYKEVKGENSKIKGYLGVLSVAVVVLVILSAIVINLTGFSIFNEGGTSLEVLHYAMNDNAGDTNVADSSGNSYTGTATAATSSLTTPGKINSALNFDGSSNYINTGNTFGTLQTFSMSVWFKADTNPSVAGLISNGGSGTYHTMYLASNHVSYGGLYFAIFDDTNTEQKLYPSIVPTTGVWHNVVIVKDTSMMYMYYDNQLVANGSISATLATPTNNLMIGTDGYGNYYDGAVDDFRLYNVALTQAQITALYNSTTVTGGAEVAHWTLNDNNIDAYVSDSSGNGYTGTAQQATNTITASGKINSALPFSGAVTAACSGDHSACSSFIASGDAACTSHGCSWLGAGSCDTWNGNQGECEAHTSFPYSCSPQYDVDPGNCACSDPNNCACYTGCYSSNPSNCACYPGGDPNNCACYPGGDPNNCACYPGGDPMNCGGGSDPCETNMCACETNGCACETNSCACSDPGNCACYGGSCTNPNNCACGAPFTGCSGTWGNTCYDSPHACSTLGSDACVADSGNGCIWTDAVSDKHIVVSYNDALNPATISVCAWVKTSASYSGWGGVVTLGNSAWRLLVSGANNGGYDGKIDFATTGVSGNADLIGSANVGDNNWHYICGVYDGSTKYIYVDGSLDASVSATGTISSTSVDLWIGANAGESQAFTGNIDDVRIYNSALSASQVSALYSNSSEISLSSGLTAPMGTEANLAAAAANTNAPSKVHYKMNDNDMLTEVIDSSGNGYTGTATANTNILSTSGKITGGFNMTGQAVNMGNSVHFMSSDFSIAMWIKADSWTDTSNILIRSHQGSGDQNGDIVLGPNADGTICFSGLDVNSNWVFGYYTACTLKTSALNTGQWYHIVAERSGTNYSIYVDGVLNNSDTSSANWNDASNTHDLAISGQTFPALPYGFNGIVDDVRIYNYSLNSSQIAFIYNSGTGTELDVNEISGGSPQSPMQLVHYTLDDNASSTNVIDNSSNSYNGTASTTTNTMSVSGVINTALNFSGSAYIERANAGSYNLGTTNYSFSFWMYDASNTLGTPMHVGGSSPDFLIYSNIDSGTASAWGGSCAVGNLGFYSVTLGTIHLCTSMSQNSWTHVVGVYDAVTANVTLYINGNSVGSVVGTPSVATGTLRIVLGSQNADANYFKGKLDDFRLYNYALNSSEISVLYAMGVVADTSAPAIFITSPQQYANYSTRTLALNYSVFDDTAMGSCWYSFDAGMTMQPAQVCGTNWTGLTALTALNEGDNRWTVYANDTAGNTNSTDVFFYVDSLAPNTNFTNPTSSGTLVADAIYVNLSTSDVSEHYSLLDFDRSLSLWYRMDDLTASGNVADSSSYSINGTKVGGGAVQNDSGIFGKAFSFNMPSYLDVSLTGFNNPSTQITISTWVRVENLYSWNNLVSRNGWDNAGNYSWIMYLDASNRSFFGVSNGTVLQGAFSPVNSLSKSTWYHIAGTYNGTTVSMYLNGVLQSTNAHANIQGLTFTPLLNYVRLTAHNGSMDETMIFNRSLSAAEIASLYNATANQYSRNFTGLSLGSHSIKGYSVDSFGNKNQTETRTITLSAPADTTAPSISVTSPSNITYNSSSSITINFTSSDETAVSSRWFYNGTGNTTYSDVVTQVLADGQHTFIFYSNDSSNNVNSTSVMFAISTANTGLPSCLAQNCTEGEGCVITSACHLDSSMCSGSICQFTNFTISAQLKTGTDSSGNALNLVMNITSTDSSPVLFLAGGAINFSGSAGTVGGNASIVNITVYNLFNTTSAFFYGTGGASTTSAKGGNGGKLQINAHGVIRWFSDYDVSGGESADNAPVLTGGSSNGGTAGTAGTKTFNKDLSCSDLRFRDIDVDKDGLVNSADVADTIARYNYRNGQALYTAGSDINCDSNINVIELSREGLQYNTR